MKENKATENLDLENEQGQEVKDAYTKRKNDRKSHVPAAGSMI